MAAKEYRRPTILTATYIYPRTRRRMERVAKKDPRMTLSKQLSESIERTITDFEQRVGLIKVA